LLVADRFNSLVFQPAFAETTARMVQYESKIPNGVEGWCFVEEDATSGGVVMSCELKAPEPAKKKQDWFFFEKEVVQLRPTVASGAACNDLCHQSRKEDAIDLIPGR